jgi:hypothetical protein
MPKPVSPKTKLATAKILVVNHRDFDRLEPLASKRPALGLSQVAVPSGLSRPGWQGLPRLTDQLHRTLGTLISLTGGTHGEQVYCRLNGG